MLAESHPGTSTTKAAGGRPPGGARPHWIGSPVGAPGGGPDEATALQEWAELHAADPNGVPDVHPELALAPQVTGAKPPVVYTQWSPGARGEPGLDCLAALVAKTVTVRPVPGLPGFSFRGLRLVGNLVLGDNSPGALAPFIDAVTRLLTSGTAECVLFEDIEVGSPLWDALHRAGGGPHVAACSPFDPQPHWWIEFPERAADYWKKFSAKSRYNLRSKARKLDHLVARYTDPGSVPEFLGKAHRVSRESWQTRKKGLRVKDNADTRVHLEAVASLGALRSYILEQNGTPLAFVLGYQWRGRFIYEEIGYDSAYAGFAPGTVLLYRVVEDVIAHDTPRLFDFGFGDADYKRLFGTRQTMSGPVLLVRRRPRPLAALWLDRCRRGFLRRFRAASGDLGLWRRLRRLYRR